VFGGFWLLITAILSTFSGWPALAESFPGGAIPPGERLRGRVLGVGSVRENNVTVLVPTPRGLYLYAMFLFRCRRSPLLVPWSRVGYLGSGQMLWARWYDLDLGGISTLRVRQSLGPVLRSYSVAIPADPSS
jgi:hypothetical protein